MNDTTRIEALVKPLVWLRNGNHYANGHGFVIRKIGKRYTMTSRNAHPQLFDDLEHAKTAAEAHHVAHVLSMLNLPTILEALIAQERGHGLP